MIAINNINFVRGSRRELAKSQERDRLIFYVSTGVFAVCVTLAVGLFAYWQYARQQLAQLKSRQMAQQRIVTESARDEAEYIIFAHQLDTIGDILQTRTSKQDALSFLAAMAVPDVSFNRIAYNDVDRSLSFRVEAVNVFSVERFLQRLRSDEIWSQVDKAQISDIRRDETGRYVMDVSTVLMGQQAAPTRRPS